MPVLGFGFCQVEAPQAECTQLVNWHNTGTSKGPTSSLATLAQLNITKQQPGISFHGINLSKPMIYSEDQTNTILRVLVHIHESITEVYKNTIFENWFQTHPW